MLARTATTTAMLAVVGTGSVTFAAPIAPSDPFLTVNFTAGARSGSVVIPLVDVTSSVAGVYYQYQVATNADLVDGFGKFAEIGVTAVVHAPEANLLSPAVPPQYHVTLGFNVRNFTTDTAFVDVFSPEISFAGIDGGVTVASSSFSMTDSSIENGGGNGSVGVVGQFAGGNMWRASYNGGLEYATILQGGNAAITGGDSANLAVTPIAGTVTSIRTQYSFSLSAEDQASGTSSFGIIPAPGAAALLAMGGAVTARRRRR